MLHCTTADCLPRLEYAHVVMLAFEMVELIEPSPNLND